MQIPDVYLARLRAAGLLVSEPFVHDHIAFPDGVAVSKPVKAGGHRVPGMEASWGPDGGTLDAPAVYLHHERGRWVVTSHDYVPGPGPGDFVNAWDAPDQAVDDILDFYFGDPSRMAAKC